MPITTINIGSAPNDHNGDTIRDAYNICNNNFQYLDVTKFDIPTGTTTQYVRGDGTLATLPSSSAATQMNTQGRNSTGATLYEGTIVYISGSTGNLPNFVKAQANSEATSAGTFGVVVADIPNNSDGYVCTIGTIDNLDTRSIATNPFTSDTLVDGDTIYLSPTTAGYVTRVKPYAPSHIVYIGKVVRTSPTNGTIVYRIQNGYELSEIHDVDAQTPSNRDLLMYDSSTQLWENTSFYQRAVSGVQYFNDFENSVTLDRFQSVISGAGANVPRVTAILSFQTANQIGIGSYVSGTTATGFAMHISETNGQAQQFQFGGGSWIYESYVYVEALSNATDRFRFLSGFGDLATAANENNGAIITYDEGGTANGTSASANWQCVTINNGVRTLTTTSVAVSISWVKLRIVVNAAATSITYFIDGTLVATHTTNIPTFASTRRFKVKQGIFKTIGTAIRNVHCDYLFYENNLTTLR
jgi:hypothetical protein